jgi:hypothetical protein
MLLAVTVMPGIASAQDPAPGWEGLEPSGLSTVHVLDDRGTETTGKLLRIDAEAIVLLVDGTERRFESAHVRRVAKRGDSLKNGAVGGAVVGICMGILAGAISDCSTGDGRYGGCGAGARIGMAVVSTAFYTAVGVGIDAMIQGRTTVYEAPGARPGPGRASLAFRLTW